MPWSGSQPDASCTLRCADGVLREVERVAMRLRILYEKGLRAIIDVRQGSK